jgi:Ras-related protein Rab-22
MASGGSARRLSGEGAPRAREVKVVLLGDTGVGKSSLVLRFVTNNFKPYSESTIGCVHCARAGGVRDRFDWAMSTASCHIQSTSHRNRASFMSKMLLVDETPMKFQIWDTAGQEKVRKRSGLDCISSVACAARGLVADTTNATLQPPTPSPHPPPFPPQNKQYHSLAPMYYKGAAAAIVVYDITRPESFGTLQKWVAELRDKGPEEIRICIAGNKKDLEAQRRVEAADAEVHSLTATCGCVCVWGGGGGGRVVNG